MSDKKRVAIHEAGHVTINMLWDLPWKSAELRVNNNGEFSGIMHAESFEIKETPIRLFIKLWTVTMAGFLAEEIYVGRELDMKTDSIGSARDFLDGQTEAFKYMDMKFYLTRFAPMGLNLTKQILEKNWTNSVLVIAEELYHHGRTNQEKLKKIIKTLHKPLDAILDQIVAKGQWK